MRSHRKHPGKALETLVSSLERALGHNANVTVQSPADLPDRITGASREHDVLITLSGSHHKSTIAIECRDRSRKVTVNDIESFVTKCQDTGVDQGMIVSPKGFSKSALAKAAHRSIRCLQLSEVSSFNWLLTPGITTFTRHVKHTNWTFFPEADLTPPPAVFTILTENGNAIESSVLAAAVFSEFQKMPRDNDLIRSGEKQIAFNSPGLLLRDDTTGSMHKIVRALAAVQYEVVEEFIPFRLVSYSDSPSGEIITDAAVAEVNFVGNKGKVMIMHKEGEDGSVVFVPDKGS